MAAAAVAAAAALACATAMPPTAGLLAGALAGVTSAAVALFVLDRSMRLGLRELANWVRGTVAGDRAP
jgi:ABC-type cobalamin transport system permease subunit